MTDSSAGSRATDDRSRGTGATTRPAAWQLYLVRSADGSLYTGIATDVARRLAEHEGGAGKAAKCLRGRGPFRLEYAAPIGGRALALRAERRVKRLSRAGKERLIAAAPDGGALLDLLRIEREGGV